MKVPLSFKGLLRHLMIFFQMDVNHNNSKSNRTREVQHVREGREEERKHFSTCNHAEKEIYYDR